MFLMWLLPFLFHFSQSTHTTLKANETLCFGIDVEPGDKIVWNMESFPHNEMLRCAAYFLVRPTSNFPPKPVVEFNDPTKTLLSEAGGTLSMCVNNVISSDITVIFSYKVENRKGFDINEITTTNDTDRIEAVSKLLLEKTREISEKLDNNQTKEKIYSELSYKMDTRIILLSILHFVILLILCAVQIYFVKSFFEVKTRV